MIDLLVYPLVLERWTLFDAAIEYDERRYMTSTSARKNIFGFSIWYDGAQASSSRSA
jgi:hypothetical protein